MRTVDDSAEAALPGGLEISRGCFARYCGESRLRRLMLAMACRLPWPARYLPLVGRDVWLWTHMREHFLHGCLNPAVVTDARLGTVAIFTNLTSFGDIPTPVVKVVSERLDLITTRPVENGGRFAAVSLYFPPEEETPPDQWSDFNPIVVDCLVPDALACGQALNRMKPLAWTALEMGLRQIPRTRPGLYRVDVPPDITWNAF